MEIGMLGELGAESIHISFNQLARTMTNGVERLKSMVAEHYRQICPENVVRGLSWSDSMQAENADSAELNRFPIRPATFARSAAHAQ